MCLLEESNYYLHVFSKTHFELCFVSVKCKHWTFSQSLVSWLWYYILANCLWRLMSSSWAAEEWMWMNMEVLVWAVCRLLSEWLKALGGFLCNCGALQTVRPSRLTRCWACKDPDWGKKTFIKALLNWFLLKGSDFTAGAEWTLTNNKQTNK